MYVVFIGYLVRRNVLKRLELILQLKPVTHVELAVVNGGDEDRIERATTRFIV